MAENATTTALPARSSEPAALPRQLLTSWSTWAAVLAAYVGLCSLLRFRFERAMRDKFNYPDRASLARMTNDDAQAILKYIIEREFPYLYKLSLQFAIFKVGPIPTE